MNDRAVGVVIKDGRLLTIWRYRNGEEYYTLPGGTMEEGETPESALVREMFEETNFKVEVGKKLLEYFNTYLQPRMDRYYLISKFSGELKMGAPELTHQSRENIFRPEWIDISKLNEINLKPEKVKKQLVIILKKHKQMVDSI